MNQSKFHPEQTSVYTNSRGELAAWYDSVAAFTINVYDIVDGEMSQIIVTAKNAQAALEIAKRQFAGDNSEKTFSVAK